MSDLENKGGENVRGRRGNAHYNPTPRGTLYSYAGRGRGRGRFDPHVAKAMNLFGVKDLRELLEQKHQGDAAKGGNENPDLSANTSNESTPFVAAEPVKRGAYSRSRSRSSRSSDRASSQNKPTFIKNLPNITVQLSTSTGKKCYKIEKDETIPNIRHVPDHEFSRRERSRSAEGRIRGRGIQRGGRGGSFRGYFQSVRGRGFGRSRNNWNRWDRSQGPAKANTYDATSTEGPADESNENLKDNELKQKNVDDNTEDDSVDQQEVVEPGNDNKEGSETEIDIVEGLKNINIDDQLVVTTSNQGDKKRTVRFSINEDQVVQAE